MSNLLNFDPVFYKKSTELRASLVQRCLKQLNHLIKWKADGNDSVLDIGCGVGDTTKVCFFPLLPPNYSRLVCSDLSPEMLNGARKTFKGVERVEFCHINIGEPLSESKRKELGTFDHIFSSFCLTYVKDQRQAFRNIYDLLENDGDILITMQATTPPVEILFRMAEEEKWKKKLPNIRDTYVYSYREDPNPMQTIENLLTSTGFTDITVKIEESFEILKSEKFLKDFMKSLPLCNELPEEENQEFYQEVINIGISMNLIEDHLNGKPPLKDNKRKLIHIYGKK